MDHFGYHETAKVLGYGLVVCLFIYRPLFLVLVNLYSSPSILRLILRFLNVTNPFFPAVHYLRK
jgi:hypothetical protein